MVPRLHTCTGTYTLFNETVCCIFRALATTGPLHPFCDHHPEESCLLQTTIRGVTVLSLESDGKYNNGQWHKLSATRAGSRGKLIVGLSEKSQTQGSLDTELLVRIWLCMAWISSYNWAPSYCNLNLPTFKIKDGYFQIYNYILLFKFCKRTLCFTNISFIIC